ncbi:MAG TPA: ATP-binding protein [Kofleriaceae bacterium]|nr:ATP-binding protein [Kofleriaceae bacterium]
MRSPLRTLSARILAGFALLIVTFGATMIWIVTYVSNLGSEMEVIRTRYLKLALVAKDLSGTQRELATYLRDELGSEDKPGAVVRRIHGLRQGRDELVRKVSSTLDGMRDLPRNHGTTAAKYLDKIHHVEGTIAGLDPLYVDLLGLPPIDRVVANPPADVKPERLARAVEARDNLIDAETALLASLNDLADSLESRTGKIASNLEYNAARLRRFTAVMGITALLIGVLVTGWVTLALRPLGRLRSAARRIAAGDYASRIDEQGPREVAELAREFNAMGRAVDERERELVRSERLAAVGKMAAMITHEVRNPLSSIGLNAELLDEELAQVAGERGEEARQLLRAITREIDRLTAITEEYLSFARLPKPRLARASLAALVDDLVRFVREELAGMQVEVAVEHAPDLPAAQFDEGQIRQALLNLVRNAAEAVSAHRGGGHVWIRTRSANDAIVVEVEDDGPGIPPELAHRLFDPFVSTKQGGTGLGLALTHQILRDHGGAIRVASKVGQGATFTLELPASRQSA